MNSIEQFTEESLYSSAQTHGSLNVHISHEFSTMTFRLEEKKEKREQKLISDPRNHITEWIFSAVLLSGVMKSCLESQHQSFTAPQVAFLRLKQLQR